MSGEPNVLTITEFLERPEVEEVLGLMIMVTCPTAHVFQKAGQPIPHKTEAEQAWVLRWLLKLVNQHGADWREAASKALGEARATIAAGAAPAP